MDILINILAGVVGLSGIALVFIILTTIAAFISVIGNDVAISFGLEDSYCNFSLRDLVLGTIPVAVVIYILYLLGAFIVAYE